MGQIEALLVARDSSEMAPSDVGLCLRAMLLERGSSVVILVLLHAKGKNKPIPQRKFRQSRRPRERS